MVKRAASNQSLNPTHFVRLSSNPFYDRKLQYPEYLHRT
jgi:hypothetical protein